MRRSTAFIGAVVRASRIVAGRYAVDLVSRNPGDNPVVACALEAGARFVVTDDRRLSFAKIHRDPIGVAEGPSTARVVKSG
jgi:hypothetical protein